ncbi:aminotransferase class IV [Haliea sp. E17]|uniref:aminotransferase class IV n=1 Tax=Haliea sp. E17 TaxID=3401576 RepID=UPI003AABDD7E
MSIVYLDGTFLPIDEARISPMDRGFLFGDGIYEVIPSYGGRLVGFEPHMRRMGEGLAAIEIKLDTTLEDWRSIVEELIQRNGSGNLGIYIHVSRGADSRRHHAYPVGITPTVFAFAFEIPAAPRADKSAAPTYSVVTTEDLRWRRCNIKSTALLGNVMHFQQGYTGGHTETLLYNQQGELTEASACNVFVVKDGVVRTPPLDHQKLPGITRLMLLEILRRDGSIPVEETVISLEDLRAADEVWLTSSTKEIAPVVEIDGQAVGDGQVGNVWLAAQTLYSAHKFDF